jgi:RHS repeat-associated protein
MARAGIKYAYGTGGAGISSPTGPSLANMNYNYKDQLIEKNIGMNPSNTGALQSIDYSYNIRGWLTNINNVALNNGGATSLNILTPGMLGTGAVQELAILPFLNRALSEAVVPYRAANANEMPPINDNNSDLFSQNITYENPAAQTGGTPQYNGNISSTTWQVLGRDKQAYGFKYDGLDRLTEANYFDITEQYTAPYTSQYSTDNKFKEAVQYDVRGNITGLQRFGLNAGTFTSNGYTAATYGMIDNLNYSYDQPSSGNVNKSNTLLRVTDVSLANKGFKFQNTRPSASAVDYTYDANGNLTSDRHKGILSISYNYLNLPVKITFDDEFNNTLEFVYDAFGVKHKKIQTYNEDNDVVTTDYINGVEYINNRLNRIAHTEGSVVREGNWYTLADIFSHEYVLRDHLGNTRVTFTDANNDGQVTSADIKQINHYYPFGLNMEGNWQGGLAGQNKYQYNGKELNQDFGLDWNDYGARFYDAALGRFFTKDRFAEKYKNLNPYQYAANNPIVNIDVNGDSVWQTQTSSLNKLGQTVVNSIIHVRGKILDLSGVKTGGGGCATPKDGRATLAKGMSDKLNSQKTSTVDANGATINVSFDAEYTVANSMSDVSESDHLAVVVDDVTGEADPALGGGEAGGVSFFDSKISYLENSSNMSWLIDTGVHEFGHNMGLGHEPNGSGNIMSYDSQRSGFSSKQIMEMRAAAFSGSPNSIPNRQISPASTSNWIYNTSSNQQPWSKNTNAGQVIPNIIIH